MKTKNKKNKEFKRNKNENIVHWRNSRIRIEVINLLQSSFPVEREREQVSERESEIVKEQGSEVERGR